MIPNFNKQKDGSVLKNIGIKARNNDGYRRVWSSRNSFDKNGVNQYNKNKEQE